MAFCDMADSTALSTRLGPEDLQDVIRGYQETSTEIFQEYGGYVARYMGDGILVYVGHSKSLERNAERAVRSAIAVLEAMAGQNETLRRERDIEIAARPPCLQARADPGRGVRLALESYPPATPPAGGRAPRSPLSRHRPGAPRAGRASLQRSWKRQPGRGVLAGSGQRKSRKASG